MRDSNLGLDCGAGAAMVEMKHRIVHALQKYVLNPPIKLLFAMGLAPPGYALLETTGRKTGKARRTPVGDARIGPPRAPCGYVFSSAASSIQ
jgi:hypothetical protein